MLVVVSIVGSARAQGDPNFETGFRAFGSYHGGNIDQVDIFNGGLIVNIPIVSYPQKGALKLSYTLHYQNLGDYSNEVFVTTQGGFRYHYWADWHNTKSLKHGFTVNQDDVPGVMGGSTRLDTNTYALNAQLILNGGYHPLAPTSTSGYPWETVDGIGFRVNNVSNTLIVVDSNGIAYGNSIQDPNGNQITTSSTTGITTDSVGRSIPAQVATTDYTHCTGPGTITSATIWNLPGVNGGTYPIKFCYITASETDPIGYGYNTGRPAPTTYNNSNLLQSMVLLNDNEAWTFQYTADGFNDLATITFPTGGTISYTWSSGTVCQTESVIYNRTVTSRTLNANDGTPTSQWKYAAGTVTDPALNDTVHTFKSLPLPPDPSGNVYYPCSGYESQTQYYQGSSTGGGTLLRTVTTAYTSSEPTNWSVWPGYASLNVFPTSVTTIWPNNQQSQIQNDPDNAVTFYTPIFLYSTQTLAGTTQPFTGMYGDTVATREYDYGNGAPGALVRTTSTSYVALSNSSYLANNLLKLPSSVRVTGVGPGSYMTYGYDEANGSPSGARGNRTSVNRWLNTTGGYLTTSYVYSSPGLVTSSKDPKLNPTTYGYGNGTCAAGTGYAGSGPTSVTNALNQTTNYCYDFNTGLKTSVTDPNGQTMSEAYDSMWRLASVSYPDGGSEAYSYNVLPSSSSFTFTKAIASGVNSTETGLVDGFGRLKQTQTAVPVSTCSLGYSYVDTAYDNEGRKFSVSNSYCTIADASYGVTKTYYDALNRPCLVVPPDGTTPSGNSCPTTSPGNDVLTVYSGACTTMTDQASASRKSCTDGLGRTTGVWEDPSGLNYQTNYTYDASDNLLSVTQNGSRQRTFAYDSLSRLTSSINPESNTVPGTQTSVPTTYSYDADGNLSAKTEPAPNQTGTSTVALSYCYDALNRMLSKTYTSQSCPMASPVASYSYDGSSCLGQPACYNVGRRTGMTDAAGSEAWSYDTMGRKLTDQRTTNSVPSNITKTTSYVYNDDGSVAMLNYPTGRTITYTPNIAAQLVSAADTAFGINYALGPTTCPNGQSASGACYTPMGSLASLKNGSSIVTTSFYNTRLQPCRIAVNTTGTGAPGSCGDFTNKGDAMDFSYDFHLGVSDNGNVYKVTNNRTNASDRNINYTYDSLNRIATASTDGNLWGETYSIDSWGNLYGIGAYTGKPAGESLSQGVNGSNQLTNVCTTNCYDTAGNLLNDGLNSYTYDAEGHSISGAGVTYYYDGDGKRVRKSGGTLYWYGMSNDALDETDGGGNLTNEYIFFGGKRIARRDSSGNIFYYFADHLGTSRAMVQQGQTTPCYDQDFYPYGREVPHTTEIPAFANTCPQNYKFTGKERDSESGLDNFGARYDSSQYGRFTSPDIGRFLWQDPQSLNRYTYARNNPLLYIDPDGKDWRKAVSDLFNALHVKFSVGTGVADEGKIAGTGYKANAEYKITVDVNVNTGVKMSRSVEGGLSGGVLGADVGPNVSKSQTLTTITPEGKITGHEKADPLDASLVRLPGGSSSSTNGTKSELSLFSFENNVVVPVETPTGAPVLVPTPFTVGFGASLESGGLFDAIYDFFAPAESQTGRTAHNSDPSRHNPSNTPTPCPIAGGGC